MAPPPYIVLDAGRVCVGSRSQGLRPHGRSTGSEREIVRSALKKATATAPLDWFAGKLDVVLDGVERSLAP